MTVGGGSDCTLRIVGNPKKSGSCWSTFNEVVALKVMFKKKKKVRKKGDSKEKINK